MVQQMIDSKFGENDMASTGRSLPSRHNQLPVAGKKTALRDLQNENRSTVSPSTGNCPFSKEGGPIIDAIKVSGTKRPSPEVLASPLQNQCTSSNAANGHLVYMRRKPEAELGKRSTSDTAINNADCLQSRNLHLSEEAMQLNPQMEELKISSIPASELASMASLMSSSGASSVLISIGKSGKMLSAAEPIHLPLISALPSLNDRKDMAQKQREERYLNLQMKLRNLDQSDQGDYLQLLRSFSSVELSRCAVRLEKKSIQLSLEEAKELQRVVILNVLGKSTETFKAPLSQRDWWEK